MSPRSYATSNHLMHLEPLRVLVLEDSPHDAELAVRELRKSGYDPQWTRVDTEDDFREQVLAEPDLILADFTLPQFDAISAVRIVREQQSSIPIIIVSGTITEDAALAAMRAGADDYLIKDRLARLGPAVKNALAQRQLRVEERRAQLALLQSEARYRRLLASMSALVIEVDARGTLIYVNETVPAVTGYNADEVLGRNGLELMFPGAARRQLEKAAAIFARGADLHNYLTRCRAKDGSELILEWSTANQYDGEGRLQKIIGFGTNVTERERAVARIRRLQELYAALSQANAALLRSRNPDELFTAVCTACVEHGGFKLAWVGLVVQDGRRLVPAKVCGPQAEYLQGVKVKLDASEYGGLGVVTAAFRERRVYICNDIHRDAVAAPPRKERAARHGLASCIALPLWRSGQIMGMLVTYAAETGAFDEETVALLGSMADNVSAALDHFERDEQRARAEAEIRRAEMRLREAQEVAKIGDWEFDVGTNAMIWSPQLYRLYGRDPAQGPLDLGDMLGYCFAQCPAPGDECIDRWPGIGEREEIERQVKLPDGRTAHHLCTAIVTRDRGGQITKLYGTVQDITERHKIEEERAEHARRLADLSRQVVRIQEEERRRLARELHDRTSPNLTVVALNLESIAADLSPAAAKKIGPRLEDTTALLEDTVAGIREISTDLHPSALDHAGIVAALRGYAEQFERRTGITVELSASVREARLPADKEAALFRIAQEALTNCVKHSQAKSIAITLSNDAERVVMTVEDDGVGFDLEHLGGDGRPGLGLITMRERAEFAGGEFHLAAQPARGVRIEVRM